MAKIEDGGPRIGPQEWLALRALAELYDHESTYFYFRAIAERSGLEPNRVRRAVRSLARKGLARYMRGLVDDDGAVAGSGYCCTPAGKVLYDAMLAALAEGRQP